MTMFISSCDQKYLDDALSMLSFEMSVDPSDIAIPQGGSEQVTLTITPRLAFTGTIVLSFEYTDGTDAPAGIAIDPAYVVVNSSTQTSEELTISVDSSVPVGTYDLMLKGVSGQVEEAVEIKLDVVGIPTDGLVAYYEFEGDGVDSTEYGNDGTPTSSVSFGPGKIGLAAIFGGPNDPGHIHIPNSSSLQFDEDKGATFAAWVRVDDYVAMDGWGRTVTNMGGGAVFAKSHDRVGAAGQYYIYTTGSVGASLQTFDDWYYNCDKKTMVNRPIDKSVGDWTHFVITLSKDGVKVYLDGIKYTDNACPASFRKMNGQDLYIGKFSDSWYPFTGAIDEFRVYNRALSPDEITTLYLGTGGKPVPGYYISIDPDEISVEQGGTASIELTPDVFNGFEGEVSFYLEDLSSNKIEGVTLDPGVVEFPSDPITLAINVDSSFGTGSYDLRVVAESETQKAYSNLKLNVTSP
ncbi:MAG: LamG domain-containing protein [Chloroflexi bacterium]|nr:LamG domain-containing protein [Chloroflexota bacterium]